MGAAMAINVSPVIALAEPAADNETATAAETVTDAGVTGAVSAAGVEITDRSRTDRSRGGGERSSGSIRAGSEQRTGEGCKS